MNKNEDMSNNIISKSDKAKMFDYLKDYQDNIKQNFGKYDYCNKIFQKFISQNDIYLGRLNKVCKSKASKHQNYILFEQDKPKNKSNDCIHHLLRHLRNAVAHGRIKKVGSMFIIEDTTKNGNNSTMCGKIDYKLFFDLINLAKNT